MYCYKQAMSYGPRNIAGASLSVPAPIDGPIDVLREYLADRRPAELLTSLTPHFEQSQRSWAMMTVARGVGDARSAQARDLISQYLLEARAATRSSVCLLLKRLCLSL